ncbi:ComEC/Rec2 family competence protein [Streptomyces sp. NPDC049954]|uniref:ComEC/Rec2 family competence protein n=1 Tax=Streptomyces sp. NPDC049954 TaxID=3155779 RepID=UPI003415E948
MHARSGHRLGAADPRQEGPADLRLVVLALVTWATAALCLGLPAGWTATGAAMCAGAGVFLLWRSGRRTATVLPGVRAPEAERERRRRMSGGAVLIAAMLLCAAASATSAAARRAQVESGPVPRLAQEHVASEAELEIDGDPRLIRASVRGGRPVPEQILVDVHVVRLAGHDGRETALRTPALLVLRLPEESTGEKNANGRGRNGDGEHAAGGASARSAWLGLLPSTRVTARVRWGPPWTEDGPAAAVARAEAGEGPRVVAGPSRVQRLAGGLRRGLREAADGLSPDARALLPGLVVGDTSRVTPELQEAFRDTDLTHLMAVSGSNFTLLLAVLLGPPGLARRAERGGLAPRLGLSLRATAVAGGALTICFVTVCRPEPSVVRAAACGAVALVALGTGRRRSMLPALAATVVLLVLWDPWLARSYGFLLSVLATGALLTVAPGWSAALRRRGVPARAAEGIAAAAAAQAVCAPVVAVLAARVSLVAVPCNLLAEVAVGPATVLGFATLAVAPIALPAARALAWCAGRPTEWIALVARTGAGLPGSGIEWPGGWTGGGLLALVTIVAILVGRHRAVRQPWVVCGCALVLVLAVLRPVPLTRAVAGWPPTGWRFAMCDVGQGDATVLATGPGTGVVVDAGPDARRVDRCLRSLGVTGVPLVLLTHFHADHVAGLAGVLRGRAVGAVQTTGLREPRNQAEFVERTAAKAGVRVIGAGQGEQRRSGPVSWQVLWPPTGATGAAGQGPNDASVVLLVRTAGLSLLLAGDLEPLAQRALLRGPGGVPRVDVLKVAHHGSAYQEPELLRRTAPRLALISVGSDNNYGHPAPRTMRALNRAGALVLRTDRHGSIAVTGGTGPSGSGLRRGPALGVVTERGVVGR